MWKVEQVGGRYTHRYTYNVIYYIIIEWFNYCNSWEIKIKDNKSWF